MIAGLELPTAGRIWMGDDELTAKSVQERAVGFVFQHYALFRHMNVADNVAFGLRVRKEDEGLAGRAREELLELVQMTHFARPVPRPAVRRPAAAGRARARAGPAAAGAAARRAVRRARREGPPGPPPLARRAAPRARRHEPAGHARPGGGARAREPGRRDARGPGRAGRRAGRRLRRSGHRVRRRVRRRGERPARPRRRRPRPPRDVPGARAPTTSRRAPPAAAYVRPHDVRVSEEETGVRGTIERMATLGWLARLSISCPAARRSSHTCRTTSSVARRRATRSGSTSGARRPSDPRRDDGTRVEHAGHTARFPRSPSRSGGTFGFVSPSDLSRRT